MAVPDSDEPPKRHIFTSRHYENLVRLMVRLSEQYIRSQRKREERATEAETPSGCVAEWTGDDTYFLRGRLSETSTAFFSRPSKRPRLENGSSRGSSLDGVPDEILTAIFGSVRSARDRSSCASVCKRWLMLLTHMRKDDFKPQGNWSCFDESDGSVNQPRRAECASGEDDFKLEKQPLWAIGDLSRCLRRPTEAGPSSGAKRASRRRKAAPILYSTLRLRAGQPMGIIGSGGGSGWKEYQLGKWLGLVAAIWVQAIAGNNYGFSNYSVALKAVGGYNQVELNNLGVAKDVGKALGVAAGLASDLLPPWLILAIGSIEGLLGYGAQWGVLSGRIPPLSYWQMCIVLCMGGNSTTWMNTAVLVTCVRNFCRSRGPVVGILKGYIGLSTAIFTALCSSLFDNDPSSFVLMLALVPLGICGVAALLLHPHTPAAAAGPELEAERRNLLLLNGAATVTAVFLLSYHLIAARVAAALLLVLLVAPLYVPARILVQDLRRDDGVFTEPDIESAAANEPLLTGSDQKQADDDGAGFEEDDKASSSSSAPQRAEAEPEKHRFPDLGEDHSPWQVVRRFEFWVLFVTLLFGMGTGTVVINNLGQIGQAFGYADVSAFVSLTSVWGFFGRIGSGVISEHYLRSWALPRPTWLALSQLLSMVGFGVLLVAFPGSLFIGSSIIGLTYGVRLAVTVPTVSELFGLKYFGLFYNFLIINIPLGSFLFSGLLAGVFYDWEADKMLGASTASSKTCLGTQCFRLTFLVMLAVCAVGFCLDVLLAVITRRVYRRLSSSVKS